MKNKSKWGTNLVDSWRNLKWPEGTQIFGSLLQIRTLKRRWTNCSSRRRTAFSLPLQAWEVCWIPRGLTYQRMLPTYTECNIGDMREYPILDLDSTPRKFRLSETGSGTPRSASHIRVKRWRNYADKLTEEEFAGLQSESSSLFSGGSDTISTPSPYPGESCPDLESDAAGSLPPCQ